MSSHKTMGHCVCGQKFVIERGCRNVCRTDGKRVYPADKTDNDWDTFRCPKCFEVVAETVPGAEYEVSHA